AARRSDFVTVTAGRIEQLRADANHVNSEKMCAFFREPRNQLLQRKGDDLSMLAERDRKNKKPKWKQAMPQPCASPRQAHQPPNSREQRDDGKIRLLNQITENVQRQRGNKN